MRIQDAVSQLTNVSLLQSAHQSTDAATKVRSALERVALIPAKAPGKGFLGALAARWENFKIDLENRERVAARRVILLGLKQHLSAANAVAGKDVRFEDGLRASVELQQLGGAWSVNALAKESKFLERTLETASPFLKRFHGTVDSEVHVRAFEKLRTFGYRDDLPFPTRARIGRELLHAMTEAKRNGARAVPVSVLSSIMTECLDASRAGGSPQSGATERLTTSEDPTNEILMRAHQERQRRLNPEATTTFPQEVESDDDEEVVSRMDGIAIYAEKRHDDGVS